MTVLDYPCFTTPEICTQLTRAFFALPSARRTELRTEADGRALHGHLVWDTLSALREDIRQCLEDQFAAPSQVFVDYTMFAGMNTGDRHTSHSDAERCDPQGNWGPNHTPWRWAAGLLYLNSHGQDFFGGELLFPDRNLVIRPKAGLLVGFPSTRDYVHEVNPVQGVRCSLSVWLTLDPAHIEQWG
jgi:hypothetical protein